ncbi:MAG: hypothetical protein HGA96_09470 [Desulfobulbaceae bacterium]|nr:hypothetical protein [Desulfobulbaceae bacterium]
MKFACATLIILSPVLLTLGGAGSCRAQAGVPGELVVGEMAAASAAMETGAANLSPLGQVERRLLVCEERLARWRELAAWTASPELLARRPVEWAGCYATVEGLVGGYRRLLELAAHHHDAGLDPWQVLGGDIAFLEGECPQVYRRLSDLTGGGRPAVTPPVAPAAGPAGLPVAGGQLVPLGEQEQLEAWNKAVGLFDAAKYDEAILALSGLVNTSYGGAAKEKMREAQTVVAKQIRSQAAGLFVKVRKTEVPAQKKKLLEESWTLLNKIVTTYPEVGIIDKVKQNLTQIEEQLEGLDPALLQHLKHPDRDRD